MRQTRVWFLVRVTREVGNCIQHCQLSTRIHVRVTLRDLFSLKCWEMGREVYWGLEWGCMGTTYGDDRESRLLPFVQKQNIPQRMFLIPL